MAGSNTVVNTNIMALNTHRSLTNVGNKQAKASERLSSGLRINSAADDAAGLAISEKMRAQIRGLDMASKNSQDAISLIQTAEGGMQEIDNMLQRIRELVVQASNDTNDQESGDRTRIQEEINQLVEEIDSMSTRVEFNKKKVISGDFSDGTTVDLVDIRTYQPADTGSTSGTSGTSGTTSTVTLADREKALAMIKNMEADQGADNSYYLNLFGYDYDNINDGDGTIITAVDLSTELTGLKDAIKAITDISDTRASTLKYSTIETALEAVKALEDALSAVAAEGIDSQVADFSADLAKVRETLENAGTLVYEPFDPGKMPLASSGGTALEIGSDLQAIYAIDVAEDDSANAIKFEELLTDTTHFFGTQTAWNNLMTATTKEEMETAWIVFATTLNEEFAAAKGEDSFATTGVGAAGNVYESYDLAAFKTKLGEILADKLDAYEAPAVNAALGDAKSVTSSYEALLNTDVITGTTTATLKEILNDKATYDAPEFAAVRDAWDYLKNTETVADMQSGWEDFAATLDVALTTIILGDPDGSTSAIISSAESFELKTLKDNFKTFFNNRLAALGGEGTSASTSTEVNSNTLFFQVGANANQKLEININAINTKALGIGNGEGESWIDIDKFSGSSTTDLLTGLDDAIAYVTVERSKLGAAQNRLEYTIKSLDISSENLSSAESRIRDTDMAKEMMNYTQANVLQQAAISMLAQANQQPQNLLSLLR